MRSFRYTAEFQAEAAKQISGRGHGTLEISQQLSVSDENLYKGYVSPTSETVTSFSKDVAVSKQEVTRLNAALKQSVTS